jgi:DNA-binding MarR family transcriptional regulator
MGVLMIAPVGPDLNPIMVGVREFPVGKLILVCDRAGQAKAKEAERLLAPLKIDLAMRIVEGDPILGMLRLVTGIVNEEGLKFEDTYINVASGGPMLSCAALSAAFVNGVKAFGVMENRTFPLPVLKFSYQELISESKLAVLRALAKADGGVESLQDLSDRSGVEKSLLSYHIRGGKEGKGLEQLGLVEIDRGTQGRLGIRLTPMGQMLLYGRGETDVPPTSR